MHKQQGSRYQTAFASKPIYSQLSVKVAAEATWVGWESNYFRQVAAADLVRIATSSMFWNVLCEQAVFCGINYAVGGQNQSIWNVKSKRG